MALFNPRKFGPGDPPDGYPVYTSNSDDPRLKAYSDSLHAYNMGEEQYKWMMDVNKKVLKANPGTKIVDVDRNINNAGLYQGLRPIEYMSYEYDTPLERSWTDKLLGRYPTTSSPMYTENGRTLVAPGGVYYRFKKPNQPIIYKTNNSNPNHRVNKPPQYQKPTGNALPKPIERMTTLGMDNSLMPNTLQRRDVTPLRPVAGKEYRGDVNFNPVSMGRSGVGHYYDDRNNKISLSMDDLIGMGDQAEPFLQMLQDTKGNEYVGAGDLVNQYRRSLRTYQPKKLAKR